MTGHERGDRLAVLLLVVGLLAFPAALTFAWWTSERHAQEARIEICEGLNKNRAAISGVLEFAANQPQPKTEPPLTEEEAQRREEFYRAAADLLRPLDCR